jgi:hypothetical protein
MAAVLLPDALIFHQALANLAKFEWRCAPFIAWL